MLLYAYVTLLLLVIFFTLLGFKIVINAPKKIKILSTVVFILILMRYAALLIMLLQSNLKYMYMLKAFNFLYFIFVPICGMISIYILIRNDKINFFHINLISLVIIVLYFLLIFKMPVNIGLLPNYTLGYTISVGNNFFYLDILYLICNIVFLIVSVNIFNKSRSDKIGSCLAIFAALITIVIIMLPYLIDNLLPQYVLGELLWIITLDYCLRKIEKKGV